MKTIKIKETEFKIKDFVSVKCRNTYLKDLMKIQKAIKEMLEKKGITGDSLKQYMEKIVESDLSTIFQTDTEINSIILDLEFDQFYNLYESLIIEPILTKQELLEMDADVYDSIKITLYEIMQNNIVKDQDIKKKHI